MKLSKRIQGVLPSATLAMTARAKAMRAEGIDILTMSAGEPDFDTPDVIKRAAKKAMDAGDTKYTPVAGTAALRQEVAKAARALYGSDYQPAEVIVGTGGKQIIFNAIQALLDPEDEALFAAPYWVSYPDMIRFAGGKPVAVMGKESDGFLPQAADWEKHLTSKSRILILNSPSNPTGATYTEAQLQGIAELVRKHPNLVVIADDIYSGLVYDAPFVGFAKVAKDLKERTLIATGVSKTFAMTGWRIGYGIGPKALIGAMTDLQGACTSGACSIAQAAAVAALAQGADDAEAMRKVFKGRRDRIVRGLASIEGLELFEPKGAFYIFARITHFLKGGISTSDALCEHLLTRAHLALVPGSAFGSDDHIRLSFACSDKDIDEAVARLKKGLSEI